MQVWRDLEALRRARKTLAGEASVALVPTMGALHDGHLSLVAEGRKHCDHVWVSVFVNPTQFGPNEDFDRYPRTLEDDLAACRAAGVSGVFAPPTQAVYPAGPSVMIDLPSLTADLEGAVRPGHFPGVCRVVAKLLLMALPEVAVFGRKDYQQWRVIDAMARDLFIPTRVIASPTVYEPDGLAMSSRNRYLSEDERKRGLALSRALQRAETLHQSGTSAIAIERAMRDCMLDDGVDVDYAAVRCAGDLSVVHEKLDAQTEDHVALVAGRVGNTRLLDNRLLPAR